MWSSGLAEREDGESRRRYEDLSDRALVDAMRALDQEALEEFMARFQHDVLLQARKLRVPFHERRHWVAELLYDVASSLCADERRTVPSSLRGYLITAAQHKAQAPRRQQAVRERHERELAADIGGIGERAVLSASSEHSIRATFGPGVEPPPLPPVLERLVSVFDEGISREERELLSWVGQRIPYRVMAEWLGIGRTAAVKRVTRLRARLLDAARRFGEGLDRAEWHEFERFLRRAGLMAVGRAFLMAPLPPPRRDEEPPVRPCTNPENGTAHDQ